MITKNIKIKHPEWLIYSDRRTLGLYLEGRIPESIAGWMLVVSLRHPLRAIYGSDLRAAWALLIMALKNKLDSIIFTLHWKHKLKDELETDENIRRDSGTTS